MGSFFFATFSKPDRSFKAKYHAFITAEAMRKQEFCTTTSIDMLANLMGWHERVT
jgi:hypothetical protein